MSHFNDILNICLEGVLKGENVYICAARFPEYASELIPLLELSVQTKQITQSTLVNPDPKRLGLRNLLDSLTKEKEPNKPRPPLLYRIPLAKPILTIMIAAITVMIATGGTTMASSNSVPGETLYWVKITKENLTLRLTRSDSGKSQRHAHLANVRGNEMRQLMARGNFPEAEKLTQVLKEHLSQSATYAGVAILINPSEMPVQNVRDVNLLKLRTLLTRNEKELSPRLLTMLRNAPPDQKHKVNRIIGKSGLWYNVVINAMESDDLKRDHLFYKVIPLGYDRAKSSSQKLR